MEEKQPFLVLKGSKEREHRRPGSVTGPGRPLQPPRFGVAALRSHSFDLWLDRELKNLGHCLGVGTPDDLIELIRNSRRIGEVD